jgi:hypothetical protein
MTGETFIDNLLKVSSALREFSPIVKRGGTVMVFDLIPWWPGAVLGNAVWNLARLMMGKNLDMYFWRDRTLQRLARHFFPHATLSTETFHRPLFSTFPPVFSLPSLRIRTILYPFDVNLYRWEFPPATSPG